MKLRPPAATAASPIGRMRWVAVTASLVAAVCTTNVVAQAPAAPVSASAQMSAEELEQLVGRIALYPDDLVAIILPASTNPLQLVQADRFLEKRKTDPNAPVDEKWDDAVKSLLNYPEIVKMMSSDLDWTAALGEAVVADHGEVLDAVQAFRRRTQSAGNLNTDDKQVVVVEKEVIKIVPANPEVIYVPQYNPTTVVVAGGYPAWGYYPSPYPVYYYPYAPGATFAAGLIWGAAITAAWNGGHYHTNWGGGGNNNINIDRDINIDRGDRTTNIDRSRTDVSASSRSGGTSQWKSDKRPGQVSNTVGKTPPRVGDSRPGGTAGARPSTQPAGGVGGDRAGAAGDRAGAAGDRAGAGVDRGAAGGDRAGAGGDRAGAAPRPSTQPSAGVGGDRAGGAARPSPQPSGGAFDSYGSPRQTQAASSRGASSRASAGASAGARAGGGGGRGGGGRR